MAIEAVLEYFDLRELQQDRLQQGGRGAVLFATKEALEVKFNQLAELRNSIRHSRTVEVTRKEGEAAILWFEQCLRGIKQADQAVAS